MVSPLAPEVMAKMAFENVPEVFGQSPAQRTRLAVSKQSNWALPDVM
jgi:hypothetical protein